MEVEDLMVSTNGSITREKIRRDKGHPCLVPFVIVKALESTKEVKPVQMG